MITVTDATPIGSHRTMAHLNYGHGKGCVWKEIDFPDYDKTFSQPLDSAMFRARITSREAAEKLGLDMVQMTGLEHGSKTCSPEDFRTIWLTLFGREPETIDQLCATCRGKGKVWNPKRRIDGPKDCPDCCASGMADPAKGAS